MLLTIVIPRCNHVSVLLRILALYIGLFVLLSWLLLRNHCATSQNPEAHDELDTILKCQVVSWFFFENAFLCVWKYLLFDCVVSEDGIDSYLLALALSNYDIKLILTLLAAHLLNYLLHWRNCQAERDETQRTNVTVVVEEEGKEGGKRIT